ncbi:DsbA family oxidoreductase [Variovorax sp. HJSM1_2]|uniref:DsbA family oxidoreductase n=1 Tax=Variovorax sp. HJSM1_2 TaxID=3366263 RepID=UPI003BE41672
MSTTQEAPELVIDIVSDVVCPWCYIGKRKLEAALALPEAAALPQPVLRWHPFQLNPDMPLEGIARQQYLEDKFGGPERAATIYARVKAAGQAVGLQLNIDTIKQQPNTLAAHTLLAYAQQNGRDGTDIKERLLRAYFTENRNIGDLDVLAAIADEGGLDGHAVRHFLGTLEARAAVAEGDQRAREMGINGVPFFIFNHKVALSGAQDPAQLLQAMQQALLPTATA